jgi:hypothetical protein
MSDRYKIFDGDKVYFVPFIIAEPRWLKFIT